MKRQSKNYAFIDSQNLNLSIRAQGWFLNFKRFRVYLKEKHNVEKAFVFIGYLEQNTTLYQALERAGFICVFKPTLMSKEGVVKGNCDAELVLHTMIEFSNYDRAIIVSGDGDFYCLVKHLLGVNKLGALMIPNRFKYSALLKVREFRSFVRFMNDLKHKLTLKQKGPHKDGTL